MEQHEGSPAQPRYCTYLRKLYSLLLQPYVQCPISLKARVQDYPAVFQMVPDTRSRVSIPCFCHHEMGLSIGLFYLVVCFVDVAEYCRVRKICGARGWFSG